MKHALVILVLFVLPSAAWTSTHGTAPGLAASDWSGIRAAYEAGRYAAYREGDGVLAARNPSQQWHAEFDGRGFTVTPDHGLWVWGLELTGHDTCSDLRALIDEGGKMSFRRDANLTEWFVNDSSGLEQGWTFQQRPVTGSDPCLLQLDLDVRGPLRARINADRLGVSFHQETGGLALRYGGLKAWDADGRNLPAHFEVLESNRIRISVDDHQARYPVTIDPTAQQAYLKASNAGTQDRFGVSVAVSGDTVAVGAIWEDSAASGVNGNQADNSLADSGAVYVFVRSGGGWSQQAYLKASNPGGGDSFGQALAISGDTIVVGVEREDSAATGINGLQANENASDSGAVYVFRRSGVTWSQEAYLKSSNSDAGDQFGHAVAIDGETVVVGANYESSSFNGVNAVQSDNGASRAGAAYVFRRIGVTWSQQAYLKASNTGLEDRFGESVAISGDKVVVGAWFEASAAMGVNGNSLDNSANQAGAAYVFTRNGSVWSQNAYLKAHNTGAEDHFGYSVAISGGTAVVGAFSEDGNGTGINPADNNSAFDAGAAYVFTESGGGWSQTAYLKAGNSGAEDRFGWSVAVSGSIIAVGAMFEDGLIGGINPSSDDAGGINTNSGAAYVFVNHGSSWSQSGYLKHSYPSIGDLFAYAISLSGGTLVVASPLDSSDSTGINGDASNNNALASGAVHVFAGLDTTALAEFNTVAAAAGLTGNNALPSAIPFHDGVENLLKYAFNLNLSRADATTLVQGTGTSGLPAVSLTGSGSVRMLRVEYLRRKGSGLAYVPKKSTNLIPGTFVVMTGVPVVTSVNGIWERVVIQDPVDPNTLPKCFALVEVTLP